MSVSRLTMLLVVLLEGCAGPANPPPDGPQARADAQTAAACREHADQVFDMRHRGQIYAPASEANTPFSANYNPAAVDRGLALIYERDRMVSDCIRNTGVQGVSTPGQGVSTPGQAPPPPALPPPPQRP
jgi:hypothetical protein